ncbi:acyl-CoA thioesterase [Ammoniphilus resinae]|uniref:Acyl-CoA hydrolase n=1 Tax=Ammoniphilus resinae TaxID=861532 RepID=A0ABS4GN57_9BACL|nr:acyl-CoA thioesterase [Ammoniphilus resinae]MBP1931699.1 acyl-CoA hydrolase [Ammoniphilus resinae]
MKGIPTHQSRTTRTSLVMPLDTNNHGTIFGGKVLSYIDEVAAISAMRHCQQSVVTASIDSVDFLNPVKEGYAIHIEAFVTWTGRTSMEIFVRAESENLLTGDRQLTTTSFLTFVAVDKDGKPVPVPPVIPETEWEQELNQSAENRQLNRRNRKKIYQLSGMKK